ncbi:MAG: PHP domain-containing protein [Eubacteriales bacterium]|nr:PHP domain-containing protein [Eubacteriales bacterium]
MDFVDMHTHSTYSDGTLTPAELVKQASKAGLKAIALTDHDTVEGIPEAIKEAEKLGLELMPGVEISTDANPEMHILGYFDASNYRKIEKALSVPRDNRKLRNKKIIKKLNALGYDIALSDIKKSTGGDVTGRVHIALALIEKGYIKSVEEGFSKLLAEGRPAYAERERLTPADVIGMLAKSGGIPVLAHPKYLGKGEAEFDELLIDLKSYGLMGIEAYYADNSYLETVKFLNFARKHTLIATGGSDFHGGVRTDVMLGTGRGNLKVGYESFLKVKEALKSLE